MSQINNINEMLDITNYLEKGFSEICNILKDSNIQNGIVDISKKFKTHTELVREFTEQSMGVKLPTTPSKMTRDEVKFIVRMVLSEMLELCTTVTPNLEEAHNLFSDCCIEVDSAKPFDVSTKNDIEIMAEQYDAFVDAWYYMLNTSVKKGVDLDGIFDKVHQANMAKKFPDGTFHRREDGKVIKPEGWKEPDILGEIENQINQ